MRRLLLMLCLDGNDADGDSCRSQLCPDDDDDDGDDNDD